MNSLPSQKRVWRRSIKYCLWIYVRYSLLHMRWQYTAKVKTARIPTEESLISVLPAIWWVNRAVKYMQLPKEVSIHWRMRWLYRLQSGTSRSTPSLRAGFRHTIMNNYGQKTIHNIPPDGLANRKILPVCAYSYVKTKTTSSMAKTSPLTEAWPKRWIIENSPFIKQSAQHIK